MASQSLMNEIAAIKAIAVVTDMQTSEEDFIDTLIKLGGVANFLITVVSFVLQVGGG